jgi:alkylhydroperoxidase family enzyme
VTAAGPLEQALLSYAETLTLDPHAVTDDDVAALTAALSPGEVVSLTVDIGMADAAARLSARLQDEASPVAVPAT